VASICVFCASSDLIADRYIELARDVGAALARRGHSLISGGGSVSCMGAVAQAAREGGAHTVGVIPDALWLREVADVDADELVVTPDMRSRKAEMDRRADAFLILPGGMGTLEELLEIWTSCALGMHTKPIVVLDPDGVFDPLRQQMARFVEAGFAAQSAVDQAQWTTDIETGFDLLER
jgi:uncharacterized protein (TIGR00730 family)